MQTDIINGTEILKRMDSLSNKYNSLFLAHTIGLNYRYANKKLNYSLGINVQPNLLRGEYEGKTDKVYHSDINFSPIIRANYTSSPGSVFNLFYTGNSVSPSFNYLQPIPDTRNLQNVIVGNPALRASFNHTADLSFRRINSSSGSSLQLALKGTVMQNSVVSNTILFPDTLNTLRQETHYLNTKGNYNIGTQYYFSLPLLGKKYKLQLNGGAGYSHQISFSDNIKLYRRGLNLNQSLEIRVDQKSFMLNTKVIYKYQSNMYSLGNSNIVKFYVFNLNAKASILKSLTADIVFSKTINRGFSMQGFNPLLVEGSIEKTFFKDERLSLKLIANDLLNQGNVITRAISDNSIVESTSNQLMRYFLLTINWKLENFL